MSNRKPSEILRAAKERIGTPEKWCKRHKDGCLCASDAICTEGANVGTEWWPCRDYMCLAVGISNAPGKLAEWNDRVSRTHTQVMTAFDRAIALAKADEAKVSP